MSLLPSAKYENLKRSFDVYCIDTLGPHFANASRINHSGLPFNEQDAPEWVDVHLVGPARPDDGFGRELEPGVQLQVVYPILQCNIFVRSSANTVAHRLHQLRDIVAAAFPVGGTIPVKDYAGDESTIGKLIIRRSDLDQEMPTSMSAEDLRQWAFAVVTQWTEEVSTS